MPHPIGILGGTFDPLHLGHLSMAQWSAERLGLNQLWLMPAGQPPHKADRPVTAAVHRLRMVELAAADNPLLRVCRHEIDKTTPSYTLETLSELALEERPWLIIGLDSLLALPGWHRWLEFPRFCRLAVLPRQHAQIQNARDMEHWVEAHLPGFSGQVRWLDLPQIDISSTLLRRMLVAGHDCRYCLHPAVWQYIQQQGLYRAEQSGVRTGLKSEEA